MATAPWAVVEFFFFNFLLLLFFYAFLYLVGIPAAKVLLLFGLCVPQFWNGLRMGGFHELNGPINGASCYAKIARQFGITHRAMFAVKLVIRHPLRVIGWQAVLSDKNAQFSAFFFLSRN